MIKKLFYAVMVGVMLFTTSCEKGSEEISGLDGTATVSFNIGTPELATRYGEGDYATKLTYAVYELKTENEVEQYDYVDGLGVTTIDFNKSTGASINLNLVNGATYQVVFWAETPDVRIYTFNEETAEITVDYDNVKSNQETYDAFFAATGDFTVNGVMEMDVTLRRPFAQLNIGASDEDYQNALAACLDLTKSSVEVAGVCNTLNLLSGVASGNETVDFGVFDIPTEAFPIDDHKYIAMNYLLVNGNVDVTLNCSTFNREFLSVPVQPNYRTNIYGGIFTSNVKIDIDSNPGFGDEEGKNHIYVRTDEELAAALRSVFKEINIYLEENLSFNPSSDGPIGGDNTEVINIDGQGKTLTLIGASSSADFVAKNSEAKIVLKNVDVDVVSTRSTESNTEKQYGIGFRNKVQLENVDLLKSVAFDGKEVTLNDVTITDDGDRYAMLISANGQTVNINGLTINAGRGIKIDDENIENPAKVTLKIENAVFATDAEAAIVVGTSAGAAINVSDINITNTGDSDNEVWIDQEYDDFASNVELTGDEGVTSTIGGAVVVKSWDEFTAALANNASYIMLGADITYSESFSLTKSVIINLNGKSFTIDIPTKMLNIGVANNSTKPDVAIKNGNINCMIYALSGNATIKNAVFGGTIAYVSASQGVISTKHANLLMENCKMTNVKKSGSTKPRSICTEGRSSGYLILRDCNFKNSNLDRPYINPLNGNTTLELTNCALYSMASNIDLGASYSWTNMNLTGCSGGFTFTISRASTSLTDEEMAVYKAIKKNNSGSMRFIFSDGEKNNL